MRLYIPSDKPVGWPIADIDDNNEENLTAPSQLKIIASSDKKSATPQHTDDNKDTVPAQSSNKGGKPQTTAAKDQSNAIARPLPKKRGRPPKNVSKPNNDTYQVAKNRYFFNKVAKKSNIFRYFIATLLVLFYSDRSSEK
uniref:Uncharacterized protein n=1 Tax=Strigamia maritima TaxID=126957 RepID=T1JML3_STRMM